MICCASSQWRPAIRICSLSELERAERPSCACELGKTFTCWHSACATARSSDHLSFKLLPEVSEMSHAVLGNALERGSMVSKTGTFDLSLNGSPPGVVGLRAWLKAVPNLWWLSLDDCNIGDKEVTEL